VILEYYESQYLGPPILEIALTSSRSFLVQSTMLQPQQKFQQKRKIWGAKNGQPTPPSMVEKSNGTYPSPVTGSQPLAAGKPGEPHPGLLPITTSLNTSGCAYFRSHGQHFLIVNCGENIFVQHAWNTRSDKTYKNGMNKSYGTFARLDARFVNKS